jgi:hypothetical protein
LRSHCETDIALGQYDPKAPPADPQRHILAGRNACWPVANLFFSKHDRFKSVTCFKYFNSWHHHIPEYA